MRPFVFVPAIKKNRLALDLNPCRQPPLGRPFLTLVLSLSANQGHGYLWLATRTIGFWEICLSVMFLKVDTVGPSSKFAPREPSAERDASCRGR